MKPSVLQLYPFVFSVLMFFTPVACISAPPSCKNVFSSHSKFENKFHQYLEEQGFTFKMNPEDTYVFENWSATYVKPSSAVNGQLNHFFQLIRGSDYQFLGEYYVIRYRGEVVSIAMSSKYLDWNVENSFQNIVVNSSSQIKALYETTYEAGRGYSTPARDATQTLLQSKIGASPRVFHSEAFSVKSYPVPSKSNGNEFIDESYIQFARSYKGPNLEYNPYSARLLNETVRHLRNNPETKSILVLGSGIGYEAVHLLKTCPKCRVDVSEIDLGSLENTRLNIQAHGVSGRTTEFHSDLFESISGKYDLIVFAPPRPITQEYLISIKPKNIQNSRWKEHVDDMKSDSGQYDFGAKLLDRTVSEYKDYLTNRGVLMIMSDLSILPTRVRNSSEIDVLFEGGYWGGKGDPREGRFGIFRLKPR